MPTVTGWRFGERSYVLYDILVVVNDERLTDLVDGSWGT